MVEEKLSKYTLVTYDQEVNEKTIYTFQLLNNNAPRNPISIWKNFYTADQRDNYKEAIIANIKLYEQKKEERKNERKEMTNHAKVGDIVVCSWGYDQTNIDFYQVTRLTKKGVYYKEIAKEFTNRIDGPDSGYCKPLKDHFLDKPERFAVCRSKDENYSFRVGKYVFYTASKTNPTEEHYCSWYA